MKPVGGASGLRRGTAPCVGSKDDAENGESEIGEPDAEERRDDALAGETRAGHDQQIISSDHDYGD